MWRKLARLSLSSLFNKLLEIGSRTLIMSHIRIYFIHFHRTKKENFYSCRRPLAQTYVLLSLDLKVEIEFFLIVFCGVCGIKWCGQWVKRERERERTNNDIRIFRCIYIGEYGMWAHWNIKSSSYSFPLSHSVIHCRLVQL